jgi:Tetratricopeptide repeat/Peptidase family S41
MKNSRQLNTVLAAMVLGISTVISAQQPAAKLTPAEWQADVKFLADAMPKQHPNLFRRIKREDFDAAIKNLHDDIQKMNEDEIIVGLMKIVAMVKDGHTSFFPQGHFRSGVYPVRFYLFKDGLFVQSTAPEHGEMAGGRVVRIGTTRIEDAMRLAGQLAFADNEMGAKENAPVFLAIPEILAGLKINENKQALDLVVEIGGKEKTFHVKPTGNLGQLIQRPSTWTSAGGAAKDPLPLYLKDPQNRFWFEYLRDQKVVYVQQNAVANKQEETVAAFYRRVMEFVAANPVEKFVLDLRNNDGGNNGLNREVVIGLIKSKVDVRGKLFVVTGRRTFSAAQNFVNELEKYTAAIFVGEPTAGRPNHYGDGRPITLPNSKLNVQVSTLHWQDMDPRDNRAWTAPQIAVEFSSDDYRSNRDPVLQAIMDYVPGQTMTELIAAAMTQNDIATFVRKYREFKSDPKNKFADTEAAMNRFGYALLQGQRVNDGVEVFLLNAESYPNSANVHDSLGDAYQAAGKKDEALKSYQKALAIDPQYPSSLEAVRKLKGQ